MLILTDFEKSVKTLRESIDNYKTNKNDFYRDSVILRFLYTYDFSIKIMFRYLKNKLNKTLSFEEMIRESNIENIIKSNINQWIKYKDNRNLLVYEYGEIKITDNIIIENIYSFYEDVKYLLEQLKIKNKNN